MSGGYLECVGNVSGRCLEDIWNVSEGYLECVRKVTGKSWYSVQRLSGRCLESIKIILSVRRILECSAGPVFIMLFFIKLHTKLFNLNQLELNGVEVLRASEPSIYLNLFSIFF